jgi:hypothetical protein
MNESPLHLPDRGEGSRAFFGQDRPIRRVRLRNCLRARQPAASMKRNAASMKPKSFGVAK